MLIACIIAGRGYWEVHQSITLTNPFTQRPVSKPKDLKEMIAKEQQTVAEVRRRDAEALACGVALDRIANISERGIRAYRANSLAPATVGFTFT
jgi:hypothetical protein